MRCHGKDSQKADRRFDRLGADIPDDNALVDLQDILDQLNLGRMPPDDEPQPSDQDRRATVAWLSQRIERHHQVRRGRTDDTALRRLNAREYRATVRDLFQMNMTMFDPTTAFPRDQTEEHLDNLGDTLVMSGHLLEKHLQAAELVVDKIMGVRSRPPVQTWKFTDGFRQQPEIDQVHRKTNGFKHMTLYDVTGADKHEGAYGPILAFREGVPHDGYYELRLKAEAVNRINPYDPAFLGRDPKEPLRLGIVPGNHLAGPLHKPQPMEPLLAEIDLADEVQWHTVRVWLDKGYTPRFTFRNGLMDARKLWGQTVKRYADQFPPKKRGGIVEVRFNAIKYGKLPHIRIHEIEIEGPLYDQWPTPSHRAVLGQDWEAAAADDSALSHKTMEKHLLRLLRNAYRRPVTPEDAAPIMRVIESRRQSGVSPWQAFGDGLKTMLCSPNFIYLREEGQSGRIDPHALAARLSYFLWSSLPDEPLLQLAETGNLAKPDVLRGQALRMLADDRSDAFIRGFLDSWLTLRELGASPPDRRRFRPYYHYHLREAMRRETELFARHMIAEDRPLRELVDADYTFVNKRLAQHYRIPWEASGSADDGGDSLLLSKHEYRQVKLSDRRRGGLLGQASVLTVTANGIDTSPVVRGVWLLENLLGTPPPPPPPDVEPLDPDVRGAKTIRDQLQKHRHVASCNDCHRKIDPLGFALENFDPIGRWRTQYTGRAPIDAAGELPTGETFNDVTGLKRILLKRPELVARSLITKLLEYGVGRLTTPSDRPAIDRIVAQAVDGEAGLREVIVQIVLSEPFQFR